MANNLKDHLKEVADAIRAKKGTSDLINPQDFATEIEGISGSGGESGEKYYIFSESSMAAVGFAHLIKFPHKAEVLKYPLYLAVSTFGNEITASIEAFSLNPDEIISIDGGLKSIKEFIPLSSYTEITKEQFYDLNA